MWKRLDGVISYLWLILTGIVALIFFRVLNRTEVIGKENLPLEKRILIVSNHRTMIDSFFVGVIAYFPKAIIQPSLIPFDAAAEENFFFNPLFAWMASRWKCIPVKRGRQDFEAQVQLIKVLKEGNLMLFPEGTRSRNGELLPGRSGVGRIIYEARPQVVPVYFSGMEKVLPINSFVPRIFRRIKIIFGKPLNFNSLLDLPNKRETWKTISKKTMTKIAYLKSQT